VSESFRDLEARCPKCGNEVFKESFKAYECKGCGLLIWKTMAGRELEREEIKILLEEGRVGPLEGFRSKMGRPFSAVVHLDAEKKQAFDFGNDPKEGATIDLAAMPELARCETTDGTRIIRDGGESYYYCELLSGGVSKGYLRTGKTILQRKIPLEQVVKMFETGKTDLLPRFISKKGRPFSAYLKLEKDKVGFEFEERKPAAKKKPAAKRGASAKAS